jgi:signal transduction histidine kinase
MARRRPARLELFIVADLVPAQPDRLRRRRLGGPHPVRVRDPAVRRGVPRASAPDRAALAAATVVCFVVVVLLAPTWRDAMGRARDVLESTVGAVRHEISHPHPHQLETLGPEPAIRAIAQQKARVGGFEAAVSVAPDAVGVHDAPLLALARELLQSAAKRAGARRVRPTVARDHDDAVVLECDDGRGCDADRPAQAFREGRLGLAACTERVEAIGGEVEVRSAPGRGTVVRAALPPTALLRSPRSFNRVP